MQTRAFEKTRVILAAAVLALAGILAAVALPMQAHAGSGYVVIRSSQGEEAEASGYPQYHAAQLFAADIDAEGKATNISWGSIGEDAVVDALKDFRSTNDFVDGQPRYQDYESWLGSKGYLTGESAAERNAAMHNPQNAAEYIAEMISASPGAGDPPSPAAGSFAQYLARTLYSAATTSQEDIVRAGLTRQLPQGYYLFVNYGITRETEWGDTNALYAAVKAGTTTLTDKVSVPAMTKKVREDSAATGGGESGWGDAADANKGQDVEYRLDGTLPGDLQAFSTYWYKFTDTLSPGLQYGQDAQVAVLAADGSEKADVTSQVATACAGNVLTVEIADVKALDLGGADLKATDIIRVSYTASLNGTSAIHNVGANPNTAYIEYSNNPLNDGVKGRSVDDTVRAYTYRMAIVKQDKATGKTLQGAGFTVQVADGSTDDGSIGKYVQEDGSLGDAPYEFITGDDGVAEVPRIDEGVYTVREATPPSSDYQVVPEATVTVTSNIQAVSADETGNTGLVLTGTVEGGAGATGAVDGGTVSVYIKDAKTTVLPVTGGAGTALLTLAGIGGIAAGIRLLKRKDDEPANPETATQD